MKNLHIKNKKTSDIGSEYEVPIIASGFQKYIGMMFKKESAPMLFLFHKPTRQPIHTWFCKFKIRCIFTDEQGMIVDNVVLKPFTSRFVPSKPYVSLLEIPIIKSKRRSNKNGVQTKKESSRTRRSRRSG